MKIRQARAEEAESCWVIRNQAIRNGCRYSYDPVILSNWTPDQMPEGFRRVITEFPFFVAEATDGRLVATGFLDLTENSVEAIFTLPDYTGLGAASRILTAIKLEAMRRGITRLTLSATPNAWLFYQKHGFVFLRESRYPSALAGADLRCMEMAIELDREEKMLTNARAAVLASGDNHQFYEYLMTEQQAYPIGKPGQPWAEPELQQWRKCQTRLRSYQNDVLGVLETIRPVYDVIQYGELNYDGEIYPLMAVKSKFWDHTLPVILITGGVHGYETSGVIGALEYLSGDETDYKGKANLLVVPCVSPWAYERISRWNYNAVDPNRQFFSEGKAEESSALMALISPYSGRFVLHVDLHETTDTDESEFSPALAARDGLKYEPEEIPDGFYLVSDTQNSRLDFQQAIINAVSKVTHIAPEDAKGNMLGFPVVSKGVIEYDNSAYHLCATMTGAPFTTTTEVYPDSPATFPDECNRAQIATIRSAIKFALNG